MEVEEPRPIIGDSLRGGVAGREETKKAWSEKWEPGEVNEGHISQSEWVLEWHVSRNWEEDHVTGLSGRWATMVDNHFSRSLAMARKRNKENMG